MIYSLLVRNYQKVFYHISNFLGRLFQFNASTPVSLSSSIIPTLLKVQNAPQNPYMYLLVGDQLLYFRLPYPKSFLNLEAVEFQP